jgi:serine O-acetyltransferase
VFGPGLRIWHFGNITVNAEARVGRNCTLHGDNCIGNNGKDNKCPVIGDNVELGVGAKIIGDVVLGDNIIIGAGAIVNHSFPEGNVVIAGVPAKIVKRL